MRTRKAKDRARLMQAALGQIPCDLTIGNVQFFNVITGEIYPASVDILDGFVVLVREEGQEAVLPSRSYYDGQGRYLIPGYIDTHMHIESTMMIPENLARAILPWGTTTVCTDPHEIGNVMGLDGVRFMLENAKKSKLRQYGKRRCGVSCRGGRRTARHGRRCRHCRDHGLCRRHARQRAYAHHHR